MTVIPDFLASSVIIIKVKRELLQFNKLSAIL